MKIRLSDNGKGNVNKDWLTKEKKVAEIRLTVHTDTVEAA